MYPHAQQFDVFVTWSRIPTTTVIPVIGIPTDGGFHVNLAHPERKGTVSQTLDLPPLDAVFTNRGTAAALRDDQQLTGRSGHATPSLWPAGRPWARTVCWTHLRLPLPPLT
jgi:hypothetical protein